jgi:hypothetical protein
VGLAEQARSLATFEPAWSVFDPSSPCYWQKHDRDTYALFSLHFVNPLYWATTVLLVMVGGWRRWLNRYELLLSAGLLLIPYVLRSHEMCMTSMGRFAAVAVPVYLVLGRLLNSMPVHVATGLLAISGFLLGLYAALFASSYRFF